jgi:putative aldouronate transport system permease protein
MPRITPRVFLLYSMVLPALILLFLFSYMPLNGILMAFEKYEISKGIFRSDMAGFDNFLAFLNDPGFWRAMRNTLVFNTYDLVFGFTAPILFAILLNEIRTTRLAGAIRAVSYLPNFLSWVVVAGMMYQVLSPSENGLVNIILGRLFGVRPVFFMTEIHLFRGIVVAIDIWKSMGWGALLYFATIAGIDTNLYEAACIDGASRLKQVLHVTLPGLAPIIVLMLLLRLSTFFTIGFERIFLLQNPVVYSVSDVIATYVYRLGLEQAQFGLTTAIGFMQSLVGFGLLLSANRFSTRLVGLGLY